MTTVRRLLIELGVEGEQETIDSLDKIHKASTSLKKVLHELEEQLSVVGKAFGQVPFTQPTFGSGFANIQNIQGMEGSEQRTRLMKEQMEDTKRRDKEQIELLKRSAEGQEKIYQELRTQVEEAQKDRDVILNFTELVANAVSTGEEYTSRAKRPAGKRGRPAGYEYTHEFPSRRVPTEAKQKEIEELESHREVMRKTKDANEDLQVSTVASQLLTEYKLKDIDKAREISKEAKANENIVDPAMVMSKSFQEIKAMPTGLAPSTIIPALKEEVKATEEKEKKEKFSTIEQMITSMLASRGLISEEEFTEAMHHPSLHRSRIAKQLEQLREKKRIIEERNKIVERMQEEYEHEEEIKQRGFVFLPAERFREKMIEKQREREEEAKRKEREGTDLKGRIGKFLARSKYFKTSKEFLKEKEEERKTTATEMFEEAQEIAQSEGRFVQYNIVMNYPQVAKEEEKKNVISDFLSALKGS